jgi:hypothetical protein
MNSSGKVGVTMNSESSSKADIEGLGYREPIVLSIAVVHGPLESD